MTSGPPGDTRPSFRQVLVVGGHLVDLPERSEARFPARAEHVVTDGIGRVLDTWEVGPGWLVISGGARGGDIIAAELALGRGAVVWLLVALPDEEFVETSVRVDGTDWEARYRALREACPTWFQGDALTPPSTAEEAFTRNNEWMLEVAAEVARPGAMKVLAVWDGRAGDGPGGTADLVDAAGAVGAQVEVVRPLDT